MSIRFGSSMTGLGAIVMAGVVACGGGGSDNGLGPDGENGGDDAAAPKGPFCPSEPAHKLCDDFDTGGPVEQGWTSTDFRAGGAVALAPDEALSPPNVAAATAKGNADAVAYLIKTFPGPASVVHVGFQFRSEAIGDDGSGATVLAVQASPDHIVTLNVGKSGADAVSCGMAEFGQSGAPLSNAPCKSGFPVKAWVHLDVTITYAPAKIMVKLNHGDNPILEAPLTATPSGDYTISLGLRPYASTGDHRALFDNVAID